MDNIKNLLVNKKDDILSSLDLFMLEVKKVVEEKNNKIVSLSVLQKPKFILFYDINELLELNDSNIMLKKILKNFLKLKKENKKLKKTLIDNENSEKNILDTKNMTAFKILALDLEEKEKLIKDKDEYIEKCEYKIEKLEENITILNTNNDGLKNEITKLNGKIEELNGVNFEQSKIINDLKEKLKIKNDAVDELKEYFMEILNKYNDILIEVC